MSPLDDARAEEWLEAAEKCVAALEAARDAAEGVMPLDLVRIIEALRIKAQKIQVGARERLFVRVGDAA